jgi:hypothetical protein
MSDFVLTSTHLSHTGLIGGSYYQFTLDEPRLEIIISSYLSRRPNPGSDSEDWGAQISFAVQQAFLGEFLRVR